MVDAPLRWIKFWPQDWISDKALRVCSPAARGVWMDLLCIMHDAEPYGHLSINGRAPTPRQIGALVGVPEKEASRLIGELEESGVCSMADNGMLYSRRMIRDKAARDVGREMGKLGGNPKLKERLAWGLTPSLNSQANYGDKHLEAEAEAEKENPPLSPLPASDAPREKRGAPTPRGHRLPEDWEPRQAERDKAAEIGVDIAKATEEFRNYWHGASGKNAAKLNWDLTFRNRLMELAEMGRFRVTVAAKRAVVSPANPRGEEFGFMAGAL